MHHDHDTNGPCGESPAVLPRMALGSTLGLKLNAEHFAEVLSKTM